MKIRALTLILVFFTLVACSNDTPKPGNRPGSGTEDLPSAEPDYSAVLADGSVRFENDTLRLNYEDGGVLYIADTPEHRLIRLDNGTNIAFNENDTTLKINGIEINIERMKLIGTTADRRFYALFPGPNYIIIDTPHN